MQELASDIQLAVETQEQLNQVQTSVQWVRTVTHCMCGILQILEPFVTAVAHHSTDSCTSNKIN